LGYAGFWLFVDEIHISTIAVSHQWRRRGLGELLLMALLDRGAEQGIHRVTLEVRVSNLAAQALYEHAGFEITSRQRRYYADNDEDAYIMVIPDLHEAAFQSCLGQRRDLLHARLQAGDASSPRVP
jgi:ribosomal-protein-alanine N-acetyltransferase